MNRHVANVTYDWRDDLTLSPSLRPLRILCASSAHSLRLSGENSPPLAPANARAAMRDVRILSILPSDASRFRQPRAAGASEARRVEIRGRRNDLAPCLRRGGVRGQSGRISTRRRHGARSFRLPRIPLRRASDVTA